MKDEGLVKEHGLLWLPAMEENKVWGTLRVDEAGDSTLETFGELLPAWGEGSHRVVGVIKGGTESITLIDCFPINTHFPGMKLDGWDWSHQTHFVNVVI